MQYKHMPCKIRFPRRIVLLISNYNAEMDVHKPLRPYPTHICIRLMFYYEREKL